MQCLLLAAAIYTAPIYGIDPYGDGCSPDYCTCRSSTRTLWSERVRLGQGGVGGGWDRLELPLALGEYMDEGS